ncbi:Proton channel OtopLc [Nymphon striatum]|nr:Proton channel OtopLc [Nymphon striatum]
MVEELRTASNKVGLEINLSKTKVMFNRNVEIQPIMTGNVALDQVDRYTYLGQLISIHRDWEPEVRRRVALGADERTRTPKPRQSASNTSLDQINKRPPQQRDPKPSPQRPPAVFVPRYELNVYFEKLSQTTPVSPSDESFPSFDRRRDDVRRQRPPGNQNEQAEPMSEAPRRVRRPNPPKSPVSINHQNNIQGAPPHPPANGRIRHKRPDSGEDPDSGLWMTQTSTGRSETRFGPNDWDGTQELLPQTPVKSDLCGSCASLASQHGGQTDGIKPLAWREGVIKINLGLVNILITLPPKKVNFCGFWKASSKSNVLIDGMITILSGMYGKILIIMGISFPLAEVISHQLPIAFYEGFYLYLFGLSIAFVCYIYLFVLGPEEGLFCCKQKLDKRRALPSNYNPSGSFYLRIGAVFFGIASMIYSGLEFGQYFELASDSNCYTIMQALTPCAQMTFTFVQLYFIFFNSKLCIRKSRNLSKFGLMHLVATNICVWLHILIQESVHQIVLNWNRHNGIYYDGMKELLKPSTTTIIPFSNVSFFNDTSLDYPLNSSFTTAMPNSTLSNLDEELTTTTIFTTTTQPINKAYHIPTLYNDPTNNSGILNTSLSNFGDFNMTNVTISPAFNTTNSSNINATSESPMSPYAYHFMIHACRHASVIGRMVQVASPFMFPCTIEYSLICASILYIMWKNIQKIKLKVRNETSGSIVSIPESTRSNKNYHQVDCSNANKGLFMGIFFLVMCIIGLVLFYVLC